VVLIKIMEDRLRDPNTATQDGATQKNRFLNVDQMRNARDLGS